MTEAQADLSVPLWRRCEPIEEHSATSYVYINPPPLPLGVLFSQPAELGEQTLRGTVAPSRRLNDNLDSGNLSGTRHTLYE